MRPQLICGPIPRRSVRPLSAGCLIFEQVDQIDFTGPFEVLSRMPATTVQTIAKELSPVRDVQGLWLSPDVNIAEATQALQQVCSFLSERFA